MKHFSPCALLLLVILAGCGDDADEGGRVAAQPSPSASDSVPPEFRAACGKPGAEVTTERTRVVIKHSECDLTGVTIFNNGRSVGIGKPGVGVSNSSGVTAEVDETTGDVTFTAEG